jgi:hypothetical protein
MEDDTNSWNYENVYAFFEPAIAEQIVQIPISRRMEEDFACWPFTRHGTYSVRSGYNLARKAKFFQERSKAGGLNLDWVATEKLWKALWKITAPGKMKIHVWRFVHDCLPSGVQLRKRQVPETGPCIFCGRMESSAHALLTCQFARVVWREVKQRIHLTLDRKSMVTNRQWLFDFLSRASELQTTTLAVSF